MINQAACVVTAALLSCLPLAAFGQAADAYPQKPIQIVVPFAAGGVSDSLARLIGQKLSDRWKQPAVVVNKPGADGNIGAQFVASAAKDGYTLMLLDVGTLTMGPVFYKSLPFDPVASFAPVTALTFSPQTLVVNPSVPARTFSELRDFARANPAKFNYANHSNAAALAGHRLSSDMGVEVTQIPYKGAAAAMTGLIGGEVNVSLVSLLLAAPQVKQGTLRAIAVASPKRMASVPNIPTLVESGVPDYEMGSWQGVLAPSGTPVAIIRKLQAAITEIVREPAVRERLEGQGAEVIGSTPEEFAALLASQSKLFLTLGRQANVKPQ